MSEFNEEFNEEEHSEEESEELASPEEFTEKYGFEHNCTCAEDWSSGNLGVVAVCYLNMCREALDVLAATREENAGLREELAALRIELA